MTVSSDYTVNVFNIDSGVRLMSFTAPSALSSVATVSDSLHGNHRKADGIIFAAGKDYAIHTYSTEYLRFYGGIEKECHAANREVTDEMFDVAAEPGAET